MPETIFPADDASYQIILSPATEISATVGLLIAQKLCEEFPVGAGELTQTLASLSLQSGHNVVKLYPGGGVFP